MKKLILTATILSATSATALVTNEVFVNRIVPKIINSKWVYEDVEKFDTEDDGCEETKTTRRVLYLKNAGEGFSYPGIVVYGEYVVSQKQKLSFHYKRDHNGNYCKDYDDIRPFNIKIKNDVELYTVPKGGHVSIRANATRKSCKAKGDSECSQNKAGQELNYKISFIDRGRKIRMESEDNIVILKKVR